MKILQNNDIWGTPDASSIADIWQKHILREASQHKNLPNIVHVKRIRLCLWWFLIWHVKWLLFIYLLYVENKLSCTTPPRLYLAVVEWHLTPINNFIWYIFKLLFKIAGFGFHHETLMVIRSGLFHLNVSSICWKLLRRNLRRNLY